MIKIFYSIKTTGLDYRKHSATQLSGLIESNGEIVDRFDYDIKPHPKAVIEPEALKVNGKTIEQIMKFPEMHLVYYAFTTLVSKYIDKYDKQDKAWLVGFNNRSFDDLFLRMFWELCGDRYIGSYFWSDSLDTLCMASQYLIDRRAQMPSFKLSRVATELGIVVDEDKMHDAVYNAELTRDIYRIVTGLEIEL